MSFLLSDYGWEEIESSNRGVYDEANALRGHGRKSLAVDRAEDSPLVDCLPLAIGLPDLKVEWLALAAAVVGVFDGELLIGVLTDGF